MTRLKREALLLRHFRSLHDCHVTGIGCSNCHWDDERAKLANEWFGTRPRDMDAINTFLAQAHNALKN